MEMKGFKSFALKTEIPFTDNFNCILGPNGSGKSNVLDSTCFVLGKGSAKGLRAEKSANLIYNGGKSKNPAKQGEVSIWFSNDNKEFPSEEKEVKITRIIKPNGQSVYKIGDKTHTKQQVTDFLASANITPDGYNIILQGDIIRMTEMNPVERRGIIEEIAGISVYEDKKNKALRELTRVEEKLNEADIILTERKTYLQELKKERDQALRFKELDEKVKRNKATLISRRISVKENLISDIMKKIGENSEKINQLQEKIDEQRKIISEKKAEIEKINREVEEKGEKEQVKVHKIIEGLKVDFALNKQRLSTLESELEKVNSRQKELQDSHKELGEKIKKSKSTILDTEKMVSVRNKNIAEIEKKIADFKKKNDLEDASGADKRVEEIDKTLEKLQEEISEFRERQQNLLREKDKYEVILEGIDERIAKVKSITAENKRELEILKQKKTEFKKATLDLNKALSDNSQIAGELSTARSKVLSRQEELSKQNARKASFLESVAGGVALQKVLELKKKDANIKGLVSELGTVKDEYSMALEIAAGNRIRSIVTEDDKTAAKCIQFLKDNRYGVASFLPMNKLKAPTIDQSLKAIKTPGVKGLAVDLVKFNSKYKIVFDYVFGNTLVVDNIETSRKIGIGTVRMVTLAGDLIELSGAMQGGFRAQKKGGGSFQQEEITQKIEQLESEISNTQSVIFSLESRLAENESLINRLRGLKAELEGDIIKTEKSLHLDSQDTDLDNKEKKRLQDETKKLDSSIDDVQDSISEKNRDIAKLKIEKQKLRDKINELRNPAKIAELNSFEEKKSEIKSEVLSLEGEIKHLNSEINNILAPEQENINKIIKQHERETESFRNEHKELKQKLQLQEKELKEKEKEEKEFYEQFKELFTKRSKLTDEVNKSENTIMQCNEDQRRSEQRGNVHHLEKAKLTAELAGLTEEFKEFKDVEVYDNKSEDLIKREINEFEKLIGNLGTVNMRALEIFDKVKEEFDKLTQKKDLLEKERTDVLVMINHIDSKKKDLFLKTYEVVDHNFRKIFKSLSTKGEASFVLEDANDPFNGGLLLKVRLTGKRFMDIRSLSGGEKTMTALAFLFAIQEHEPASFYVLDEVDAALDKKNSEMLAKLVRSYCKGAQYIVISHNDSVIAEADTLYGISMNEHGMSKVTSLKM